MDLDPQKIVELETIIPTIAQGLVEAIPGVEVVLRDDIVILSSHSFPSADINRAYLFRTKPESTDALIDEVVDDALTVFHGGLCCPDVKEPVDLA